MIARKWTRRKWRRYFLELEHSAAAAAAVAVAVVAAVVAADVSG